MMTRYGQEIRGWMSQNGQVCVFSKIALLMASTGEMAVNHMDNLPRECQPLYSSHACSMGC